MRAPDLRRGVDHEGAHRARERRDAHGPGRLLAQREQRLLRRFDALEDHARVRGERDAGVGQRDAAAMALEQGRAALELERGELLGHRGRTQRRRARDGPDGAETLELDQQAKTARVEHCEA